MRNFPTHLAMNKRRLVSIAIYFAVIGTYMGVSITKSISWNHAVSNWRQNNIKHSPTVYITRTGTKYHEDYHYETRNFPISLFEAFEKGYKPCETCDPPPIPTYSAKPAEPNFFFYHWLIFTIIFSVIYWTFLNELFEKYLINIFESDSIKTLELKDNYILAANRIENFPMNKEEEKYNQRLNKITTVVIIIIILFIMFRIFQQFINK